MKEKIYVVMHASVTADADSKKNGTVDILFASKDIEKAKAYKDSLAPYEVTAIYPMVLDRGLDMEATKPALSIDWTDLQ
ncbi:MAG: hypothetical protein HDR42_01670 [Lactobacillus sp.]|nr:hypothetical protein [Lactobacillus sp.]